MSRLDIPPKVLDVLCGRGYVSPDAYDDLPATIRWCTDMMRDPFCPERFHPELRKMLDEATCELARVQCTIGNAG